MALDMWPSLCVKRRKKEKRRRGGCSLLDVVGQVAARFGLGLYLVLLTNGTRVKSDSMLERPINEETPVRGRRRCLHWSSSRYIWLRASPDYDGTVP